MKNRYFIIFLIVIILFSGLVFIKILKGRTFDFAQNNRMITVSIEVLKTTELDLKEFINESVYRSGVATDGKIVSIDRIPDGYIIVANIPVTYSGPYMKFGSQPVKMSLPFVIEGNRFYFEGIITYIEAGEEDEK